MATSAKNMASRLGSIQHHESTTDMSSGKASTMVVSDMRSTKPVSHSSNETANEAQLDHTPKRAM